MARQRLVDLWDRRQPARTGVFEHESWGIYGIGIRYQATAAEDEADWEDLVRAEVNWSVCELSIAL
jgi:hypothetical protein